MTLHSPLPGQPCQNELFRIIRTALSCIMLCWQSSWNFYGGDIAVTRAPVRSFAALTSSAYANRILGLQFVAI